MRPAPLRVEDDDGPTRTSRCNQRKATSTATAGHLGERLAASAETVGREKSSLNSAVFFTVVAVGTAFALFALPSTRRDYRELSIAGFLGAGLIVLAHFWKRFPRHTAFCISLGYVALAALLRDAAGGGSSGFGGLFLLPVLWLALTAGALELAAIVVAVLLAQLVPILAVGAPWYPPSGGRAVVVFTSVAGIAGLMVHRLVEETRRRAALLQVQTAQLEEQNEQLLEVDRMKDELIAVVSHELRTPLTSITGYLEMALDDVERSNVTEQRSHLLIMQRNVDRLVALVNQLLFLARADAHGFTLDRRPVEIAGLMQEAAETARPGAGAKSIDVQLEVGSLPSVLADREEIARLLDNLVSNAVKFTPSGGEVRLRAFRAADHVIVEVTDTGAGIAPDEQTQLFERFSRTKSATENAVPGSGLGLAISQMIAEAHETAIEVESAPGLGSTFRVGLPLAARTTSPLTPS
jgi:signal transduction histidine kinase